MRIAAFSINSHEQTIQYPSLLFSSVGPSVPEGFVIPDYDVSLPFGAMPG